MRKTAPWPVDWLDPAEAIARRAMTLLEEVDPGEGGHSLPENERDIAVFTSGRTDFATRRLLQGFGLAIV
jgi:glutamate racemase